jgi:hypothetical protein
LKVKALKRFCHSERREESLISYRTTAAHKN